ncbi:hypothetical protein L9F63_018025, partial [Diploptera punctata]
ICKDVLKGIWINERSVIFITFLIVEINSQVALFRDLLIHVGQAKDSPELREKIRKLRRTVVDACRHTSQILLPQVRSRFIPNYLTKHSVICFLSANLHNDISRDHCLLTLRNNNRNDYKMTYVHNDLSDLILAACSTK